MLRSGNPYEGIAGDLLGCQNGVLVFLYRGRTFARSLRQVAVRFFSAVIERCASELPVVSLSESPHDTEMAPRWHRDDNLDALRPEENTRRYATWAAFTLFHGLIIGAWFAHRDRSRALAQD